MEALSKSQRWNFGQLSWILCEVGRNPYTNLVTGFIFPIYFVERLVGDPVQGQFLWGMTMGFAMLVTAFLCPVLGSISDQIGRRKPGIFILWLVGLICMFGLSFPEPGKDSAVTITLILILLATVANEASFVFTNALLPHLSEESQFGKLSGLSWAFGLTSSVTLLLSYPYLSALPWSTWLGFGTHNFSEERLSAVICGVFFTIFFIPLLLFTRDAPITGRGLKGSIKSCVGNLIRTTRQIKNNRTLRLFFIADGFSVGSIIGFMYFTAIYASTLFNWSSFEAVQLGVIAIASAGIFATVGGILDDLIGARRTLIIGFTVGIVAWSLMASIGETNIGFLEFSGEPDAGQRSIPEQFYLFLSILVGMTMGIAITSMRSLLCRIADSDILGELFGIDLLVTRSGAICITVLISLITTATGNQRIAIFPVVIFMMIVALYALLMLSEQRRKLP